MSEKPPPTAHKVLATTSSLALAVSLVLHGTVPLVAMGRPDALPDAAVEVSLRYVELPPDLPPSPGVEAVPTDDTEVAEPTPEPAPDEAAEAVPEASGAEGAAALPEPEAQAAPSEEVPVPAVDPPADEAEAEEAAEPAAAAPADTADDEADTAPGLDEVPAPAAEASDGEPVPADEPAAPPAEEKPAAPQKLEPLKQIGQRPALGGKELRPDVARRLSRASQVAQAERRARRLEEFRLRRERARQLALARKQKAGQGKGARGQGKQRGQGKKVIPPELKVGKADEVWACGADDRGLKASVLEEEPISEWVSLIPTLMMTFPTEPGLSGYLDGVSRIVKRKRRFVPRAGPVELALPAQPIEVSLEEPGGVKAYLGRADARCLVGFRWNGKEVWPLTVTRMPARVVDASGHEFTALVDVTFHEDATFEFAPHGGEGELPLSKGRLEGGDLIEDSIAGHVRAARTAQTLAEWFGLDLSRFSKAHARAEEAKQKRAELVEQKKRQRLAAAEDAKRKAAEQQARRRRERGAVGHAPPPPSDDALD